MYFDMGCAVKCLIGFVAQPLVVVFSFFLCSFDERVRFHLFIGLSLYISLKSCFSPFIVCEMPFVLFHFFYTLMRKRLRKKERNKRRSERDIWCRFSDQFLFLVAQHNLDEVLCVSVFFIPENGEEETSTREFCF